MAKSFLNETFRLPNYVLSLDEDYAGGQTTNCAYEDWDELSEDAEYQGHSVTLNKPFRSNDGKHKFYVYVKNDKNNVIKLGFGDPNMEIKRDDPDRRKAYRDRHDCANPGPKWKAEYWSCKMWADKPVSKITEANNKKFIIAALNTQGHGEMFIGPSEVKLSRIYNGWKASGGHWPRILSGKLPPKMTPEEMLKYVADKFKIPTSHIKMVVESESLNDRLAKAFQDVAKSHSTDKIGLWKYHKTTGLWRLERTCTMADAEKWLHIFQKDDPTYAFKLSKVKPSQKPEAKYL